jgi:hypothetical protein
MIKIPRRPLPLFCSLLAACASPGPIPRGDKPAWVSTPNGDVRFPPDRFIAQVGTTSVGVKSAPEQLLAAVDAAARAAVAASLTSVISSEVKNYESVQTQNGQTTEKLSAEQRVSQVVQDFDLVAAIEIQGRWREGDTAYAWAVFDKQKALTLQQGKVDDREKLAKDLLAQGAAAEGEKPADALRAYARARTEAAAAVNGGLLVRALGGKSELSGTMAQAESRVAALMGELTLSVVEGDQQRAAEGKPLPQPIVFTAWLKGKRAVGLPMAVTIANGGRASNVTVGPEGKAEVRVDDVGKFARNEQQIQIAVDWPGLLGVGADKVPAWIAASPTAGISAVALKKGVSTTRVLVLIYERVDGGAPVAEPPVAEKITNALKSQGFDVQNGQGFLDKFGAERISKMGDAELRAASRRVADMVVIGSATSRYSSNFGSTTVWHRARADIRAIEVGTGTVVFTAPTDEVKSKRPGELNVAGRSALEELGAALSPNLGAALKKAAEQ